MQSLIKNSEEKQIIITFVPHKRRPMHAFIQTVE